MGLFSKLKELFSKKVIENFQEFEIEFGKLQKKTNSEIIALIGIQGRFKGLPLIYVSNEEESLRKYSARVTELVDPLKRISEEKQIKDVVIYYEDSILLYKPLLKSISFFAVNSNKNNIPLLQQWVLEKEQVLRELFHDTISG